MSRGNRRRCLMLRLEYMDDGGGVSAYTSIFSRYVDADVAVLPCRLNIPVLSGLLTYMRIILFNSFRRFDLIICNHIALGKFAVFAKYIFGIEYILVTHGWEVASRGMYAHRYSGVIKNAKKIISVSNFTKNEILRQYPVADKIAIIHPMIDCEALGKKSVDPAFKKRLGLQDKKILLTVGRLEINDGRKGHDIVLMALPKIIKRYPNLMYLVVGDGEAGKTLARFADKLGVGGNVIFRSYDKENIHNYYSIADIFIMPSRVQRRSGSVEGFGIVFLEAAFFAKPVIGGNTGGISDAVADGKTGILVNPLNVDMIANAVIRLLDDPDYAGKLGDAARERVLREFSAPVIGAKIKASI